MEVARLDLHNFAGCKVIFLKGGHAYYLEDWFILLLLDMNVTCEVLILLLSIFALWYA
jgi:hypothetical protein